MINRHILFINRLNEGSLFLYTHYCLSFNSYLVRMKRSLRSIPFLDVVIQVEMGRGGFSSRTFTEVGYT